MPVFRMEDWDPPIIREVVGNILCGIGGYDLYEKQLRLRTLDKEFSDLNSELRAMIIQIKLDTQFQLRDTLRLQGERIRDLKLLKNEIKALTRDYQTKNQQLEEISSGTYSDREASIVNLHQQIGYANSQMDSLSKDLATVEKINELSAQKQRLMIFDNIEDKGMKPERSQHFQKLILEASEASKTPHQIIFTTSMINPEMENDKYVIGKKYDQTHKTLNMAAAKTT